MVVIEVSRSQGRAHVGELSDTMKLNRYKTLLGKENDWNIVDTAVTEEEALAKAAFWNGVLRNQIGGQHELD